MRTSTAPSQKRPHLWAAVCFALTEKATQTNALERFRSDYDGWIVPVASVTPFKHHSPSRKFGIFNIYDKPLQVNGRDLAYYNATQSYATLFSVTEGLVIAVPAGQTSDGLPVGLQWVGRRFEDGRRLDVAKLMELLLATLRTPRGLADASAAIVAINP